MEVQASTATTRVPGFEDLGLKPVAKTILGDAARCGFITPKDIARMLPKTLVKRPQELRAKIIQLNAYLGLMGIVAIAGEVGHKSKVSVVRKESVPKKRGRAAKKMDQIHDGAVTDGTLLSSYMKDARGFDQIPHEDLLELAIRVQNDGDEDARNQIVQSFLPFAIMVARRYRGRGLEYMDLIQEANEGLITAAEKFEPERGYRFGTYAMWWVRQSITRAIQDHGKMIRIPVHLQEKRSKVVKVADAFVQEHGREGTAAEIAEATSLKEKEVENILRAALLNTVYLGDLVDEDSDRDATDFHPAFQTSALNPELYTLAKSEYERVREELMSFVGAVLRLGVKDDVKRSFVRRYGLDGSLTKLGFREIAELEGVTHQAINLRVVRTWKALEESGETADEAWLFNLLERVKDLQDLVG